MFIKKLRIVFLILLFFSLFISCENSISYEDDNQNPFTAEESKSSASVKYGSINGYYQNYGGALPALQAPMHLALPLRAPAVIQATFLMVTVLPVLFLQSILLFL